MCTHLSSPLALHPNMQLPFLLSCKSFLNFNDHIYPVTLEDNLLVVDNNPQAINSTPIPRFIITTLKVIGWMTLVLPALAYLGALIFHSANPLISRRQIDAIQSEQIGQLQARIDAAARIMLEINLEAEQLKTANEGLTKQNEEGQSQISSLQTNLQRLQKTFEENSRESKSKLAQLETHVEQTLSNFQQERSSLIVANQCLVEETQEKQNQISDLQSKLQGLQGVLEESSEKSLSETARLKTDIKLLQEEIVRLKEAPADQGRPAAPTDLSSSLSASFCLLEPPPPPTFPEQLASYLGNCCPYMSFEQAAGWVEEGRGTLLALRENLLNGYEPQNNEQNYYTKKVTGLIWFLMAKAISKNQGFEEGTFIIEDPQKTIYEFLNKAFAYHRRSSHLPHQSDSNHQGLDFSPKQLPASKTHVLFFPFSLNDQQFIFIKPENHGLQKIDDAIWHAWELILAQSRKFSPWGSDEQHGWRKERIPASEADQFNALVQNLPGGKEAVLKAGKSSRGEGIHVMWKFLSSIENPSEELQKFKAQLETDYDHLNTRIGCEGRFASELWQGLENPLIPLMDG